MMDLDREKKHAFRNSLMAMEAAAALAYERLFGAEGESQAGNTPAARARIAAALARMCAVYRCEPDRDPELVPEQDLWEARFFDGGGTLETRSGVRLEGVAIRASDLPAAIAAMDLLKLSLVEEIRRDAGVGKVDEA